MPIHRLREEVKNTLNATHKKHITTGMMLWRIKKERLFLQWGYAKISAYYRDEARLSIVNAAMHIAVARRCVSFGLTPQDMRIMEDKAQHLRLLAHTSRLAHTKRGMMQLTQRTLSTASKQEIKWEMAGRKHRTPHGAIGTCAIDYEAAHYVNEWICRKLPDRRKSLLIPFLVVKALRESQPGGRRKKLHLLFLRHDIDKKYVPEIFRDSD